MKRFIKLLSKNSVGEVFGGKTISGFFIWSAMIVFLFSSMIFFALPVKAEAEELPAYLADRGKGVPLSMFGTYIEKGELIIYPFYEYYYDHNAEYDPSEFGYGTMEEDHRGTYEAHEGIIFLGYGISENLAAEFEIAVITARLEKADDDTTNMPDEIEESGLGDVEGQIRWRFLNETESMPDLFTYFETVFPLQKSRKIIGTQDWELKLGVGVTKGFGFGTLTIRTAAEYDRGEDKVAGGEYALEYLKKLSDHFKLYLGIEGEDDEVEMIPEIEWEITESVAARLNLAFGLTSKATDFAPEAGVMFRF